MTARKLTLELLQIPVVGVVLLDLDDKNGAHAIFDLQEHFLGRKLARNFRLADVALRNECFAPHAVLNIHFTRLWNIRVRCFQETCQSLVVRVLQARAQIFSDSRQMSPYTGKCLYEHMICRL